MDSNYTEVPPMVGKLRVTLQQVNNESENIDTLLPEAAVSIRNTFVVYYTPMLITFGVVSNILCSFLFLHSILRKFSSSHYLCSIVLLNTLYLLVLLLTWLTSLGYNVYHRPVLCHLVDMLSNLSSFLCLWLAVAFCVDRYIAISWPQESPKMCTPTRAKIVILCLIITGIIIYLNTSLTVGVVVSKGQPKCIELPVHFRKIKALRIINLFVNHILPYMVVMILLLLIGRTIYWQQRGLNLWQTDHAQIRQTTFVYFIVFLIAHIPADSLRTAIFVVESVQQTPNDSNIKNYLYKWHFITQYLSHTAMSLNLIILLFTYQLFRQCFLDVFKLKRFCFDKSLASQVPECIELKVTYNGLIQMQS